VTILLPGDAHKQHAMTSLGTPNPRGSDDVTDAATYAASRAVTWAGNDVIMTTTVRDLEQAMKRHLPTTLSGGGAGHDQQLASARHRRRAAAHWTPYHVTSMTSSPLLPASDLLRTLHDAAVRRQHRGIICSSASGNRHSVE